jgi:hypothetical protein
MDYGVSSGGEWRRWSPGKEGWPPLATTGTGWGRDASGED